MRAEVIEKLLKNYNELELKRSFTAIKYKFIHKGVNVNLYFDAYDNINPSLTMILALNKSYYYTSLNVKDTALDTEYLEKIPADILSEILDDNKKLNDFFIELNTHILDDQFKVINYGKDIIFTNTMKYSKNRDDLPFLQTIRKVRMSDKTLSKLAVTMGIDFNILRKIQNENMTLVRTDDFNKRKTLTMVLDGTHIKI